MRGAVVSLIMAAALMLGGCSLLPNDGPVVEEAPIASPAAPVESATPADPASVMPPTPEETAPALSAAEGLAANLKESLGALAQTTKAPNRSQMLAAMLKAGAIQEKVEVSIDVTPTGLAVDAIEAATAVANECVVGQVRDGNVAVTILPTLASGRCFVGDVK